MTRHEAIEKLMDAGMSRADAEFYVKDYPSNDWPEIIAWANRPPGIDACDDFEADEYYGS